VRALAAKGVKVAVVDVQPLSGDAEKNPNIKYFACDIADPSAVASTADAIRASWGPPSILVNNAGIAKTHGILDTSNEFLHKLFGVNVFGHWSTVKAFLPDMIKQKKGHVVTVASMASYSTVNGIVDYCATKAAILAFHEGLNSELRNIHHAPSILTTSVHPSYVATALTERWGTSLASHHAHGLVPVTVADAIVAQILSCKGGQLVLPSSGKWVTSMAGWPNWMQEAIRDKASKTMFDREGKLVGT